MSNDRRTKELYRQDPSVTYVSGTATLSPTDQFVNFDTDGTFNVTLPAIADCVGKTFSFYRSVTGTGDITVIDAGDSSNWSNLVFDAQYDACVLYASPDKWHIGNEIA